MHYFLVYDVSPDYLPNRHLYRQEHLKLAWEAHARGELVLAGALGDPVDSAVLLFKTESPQVIEAFANADPYVRHGLVLTWKIKPWMTVVGTEATTPIRPEQP